MATGRRRPAALPVVMSPVVWREEGERLARSSRARVAAERERAAVERDGIALTLLSRCEPEGAGADGTRLGRLVKTYVPMNEGPASGRPFGFVFSPEYEDGPYLELVAYGERPSSEGDPQQYERAHKRLHGAYPDE